MKKIDKTMVITSLICILPILFGALMYNKLPEQIPTHWNFNGEIDDYSSKATTVFILPIFMLVLNIITNVTLNNDPKKRNMAKPIVLLGKWTVPIVTVFCVSISLLTAMGIEIPIEKIVPVFVGILFICVGNYLPKCKQNYSAGIKLPWTLNSEENWNKTHRLAGYVWMMGGVIMLFLTVTGWSQYAFFVLMMVLVLIPSVYSYSLYKKGI